MFVLGSGSPADLEKQALVSGADQRRVIAEQGEGLAQPADAVVAGRAGDRGKQAAKVKDVRALSLLEGVPQTRAGQVGGEVEVGALEGGDRNPGDAVGVARVRVTVDVAADAGDQPQAWGADVPVSGADAAQDAVQARGVAVAEQGPGPAGQDSRHTPPVEGQPGRSDHVDPAVDPVQPPVEDPPFDQLIGVPEHPQLVP